MKFGAEEVYHCLEDCLNGKGDEFTYNIIYSAIETDTKNFLYRKRLINDTYLLDEDVKDVVQEVQMCVYQRMVKFVEESKDKTEKQRNSFLSSIINSRAHDFQRAKKIVATVRYDDPDQTMEIPSDANIEEEVLKKGEYYDTDDSPYVNVDRVCKINTGADKLIAYFYCKICHQVESQKKVQSASIKGKINDLKEKTLNCSFGKVRVKMDYVLDKRLPDKAWDGLDVKLKVTKNNKVVGETVFRLSEKQVSDGIRYIDKKLLEGLT